MTAMFGLGAPQPWQLPGPPPTQGPSWLAPGIPVAATLGAPANPGPVTLGAPAPQPVAAVAAVPKPTVPAYAGPMAAAAGGMQAGQVGASAYDTKSGIAATLGAGAAGALAGAPAGPAGIAAGAVTGLAVGGLNAWLAVGKENKANRDRRKILAEAAAEQKRRDEIARADAVDGLAYERKQVEEAKRLEEWNRARALIAEARAKKKARSEEFISKGYVA